jgi:hypothetical protein
MVLSARCWRCAVRVAGRHRGADFSQQPRNGAPRRVLVHVHVHVHHLQQCTDQMQCDYRSRPPVPLVLAQVRSVDELAHHQSAHVAQQAHSSKATLHGLEENTHSSAPFQGLLNHSREHTSRLSARSRSQYLQASARNRNLHGVVDVVACVWCFVSLPRQGCALRPHSLT